MVRVNVLEAEIEYSTRGTTSSRTPSFDTRIDSIQKSIGTLLWSYTRAINKQQNRSGSLFRKVTKSECITYSDNITPSFINSKQGSIINIETPEEQYPQICYSYILNNPLRAGLVSNAADWEFSSAKDVVGLRNGNLINKEVIKEYGLVF